MKLNRALQLEMLRKMADHYPERCREVLINGCPDEDERTANLLYLEEHGLVAAGLKQYMGGNYGFIGAKITATGLDFLADDGGLSAVLGVVTIKFHDDTLRALIAEKISSAPGPESDKSSLLQTLKSLPSEALKHLTMQLLEQGLTKMPDLIQQASRYLSL